MLNQNFLHYFTLLLEKEINLFPLSMKVDGFSFLVHQAVHQWKTFRRESRRYIQWQRRRS